MAKKRKIKKKRKKIVYSALEFRPRATQEKNIHN